MSNPPRENEASNEQDVPAQILRLAPHEIEIRWRSGARRRYTARLLREACPCATCRERRRGDAAESDSSAGSRGGGSRGGGLPILAPAEARPLTIDTLRPVGHYGYNIAFGDGHQSGIFTLEVLRGLGTVVEG